MQTLKEYIESEIIPRYDNFDGAHKRDHVRSVIGQSQELSKYYDVNPEILYAAAAYHDLGLYRDGATSISVISFKSALV